MWPPSWEPVGLLLLLPVALAAPTSIQIAPGVTMPTVSNGYISGIYSKGKNATETIVAYNRWIVNGGRGIDTAFECKNFPCLDSPVALLCSLPVAVLTVIVLSVPCNSCCRSQPG